jgi:hypothetical protein
MMRWCPDEHPNAEAHVNLRQLTTLLLLAIGAAARPARADDSGATIVRYENAPPDFHWASPTKLEIAAQTTAIALIWVDVLQSFDIARHRSDGWVETNPLLGPHPSNTKLVLMGGLLPSVVLTAVWLALPPGWRYVVPAGTIAVETSVVVQNHAGGMRIRF